MSIEKTVNTLEIVINKFAFYHKTLNGKIKKNWILKTEFLFGYLSTIDDNEVLNFGQQPNDSLTAIAYCFTMYLTTYLTPIILLLHWRELNLMIETSVIDNNFINITKELFIEKTEFNLRILCIFYFIYCVY